MITEIAQIDVKPGMEADFGNHGGTVRLRERHYESSAARRKAVGAAHRECRPPVTTPASGATPNS